MTEIQKYAQGVLLYVPPAKEKAWGEVSGQKRYYQKRNRMLVNKFIYGTTVGQLAEEYRLSEETVKKIVYSRKNANAHIFYLNEGIGLFLTDCIGKTVFIWEFWPCRYICFREAADRRRG